MKMKNQIIISLFLLISVSLSAQEWEVPAERNSRLSPFEFTGESVTAGNNVYDLNCKVCHGDPGKGNVQALVPPPTDPAGDKMQLNTDGSLQFKISEGRGLMPSFSKVLSPDDIWNVISYIRSFNNDYTQAVEIVQKLSNVRWSEIKIGMGINPENNSLIAIVTGLEGEEWTPVPNTELRLSAKRYFGSLTLDVPKLTDSEGKVEFQLPDDLPGDKDGNIDLSAQLTDIELFGEISSEYKYDFGVHTEVSSLTENRAMWNSVRKAPVWLLIAFPGVVLAVWTLIFFVLFQIRKIYQQGEEE